MKRSSVCFGFCLVVSMFLACDDILEEDISEDTFQVLFPLDQDIVLSDQVNFQWDFLEGADSYRIQVFSENQNTGRLLDSLVTVNNFIFNLNDGLYTWRLRGENFGYVTPFSEEQNFQVQSSDDLTNQIVVLQTPSNELYTNEVPILYTWQERPRAQNYRFELLRDDGVEVQTIVQEDEVTSTSISPAATLYEEDATYVWKVKAMNASSETAFSTRILFIDRELPAQAVPLEPMDLEVFDTSATVEFTWQLMEDTGIIQSERRTLLELSTSEDFLSILDTLETASENIEYTFSTTGNFYWRLQVADSAGNVSAYTQARQLTIN